MGNSCVGSVFGSGLEVCLPVVERRNGLQHCATQDRSVVMDDISSVLPSFVTVDQNGRFSLALPTPQVHRSVLRHRHFVPASDETAHPSHGLRFPVDDPFINRVPLSGGSRMHGLFSHTPASDDPRLAQLPWSAPLASSGALPQDHDKTPSAMTNTLSYIRLSTSFQHPSTNQVATAPAQPSTVGNIDSSTASKDKPSLACAWCGKQFARASKLRIHERTHTGDRPYQCTKCPKKFARPDHLRNHMRIHLGMKPFECDACGRCFGERSNLLRHQKRVHNAERGAGGVSSTHSSPSTETRLFASLPHPSAFQPPSSIEAVANRPTPAAGSGSLTPKAQQQ